MTDDQQVIEHLAKVMGWHLRTVSTSVPTTLYVTEVWWVDRDGTQICLLSDWQPLIEDHDAMQVVDAMLKKGWYPHLFVVRGNNKWVMLFLRDDGGDVEFTREEGASDPSRTRAISMAAYEATKEA